MKQKSLKNRIASGVLLLLLGGIVLPGLVMVGEAFAAAGGSSSYGAYSGCKAANSSYPGWLIDSCVGAGWKYYKIIFKIILILLTDGVLRMITMAHGVRLERLLSV